MPLKNVYLQKTHTYRKYLILKNLCLIESYNFNLIFLKLRNLYYDLVLLNRRPQNNKKKCWGKITGPPRQVLPQNVASPHSESKNSHCPQGAVFEKSVSPTKKGGRHYDVQ